MLITGSPRATFSHAGAEDRATLTSDLSAAASERTDGQSLSVLPFFFSALPIRCS